MNSNFPIAFREAIEKNIDLDKHSYLNFTFLPKESGIAIYSVANTNFYFKIKDVKVISNQPQCIIEFCPSGLTIYSTVHTGADTSQIGDIFRAWLKNIHTIINYQSPFDYHSFYEAYDFEFFEKNSFNEGDSSLDKPLKLSAQEHTVLFLEAVQEKISEYLAKIEPNSEQPDAKSKELQRVQLDIEGLKDNIGGYSKRQVFKLISRYLSIIRTHSFPLFKEISKQYFMDKMVDLVGKGVSIAIEAAKQLV